MDYIAHSSCISVLVEWRGCRDYFLLRLLPIFFHYVLDCYQKALICLSLHYIPAIVWFEFIALCLDFKICFLCLKVCNDMACIVLLLIDCGVEVGYCMMNVWNLHLIMFRERGILLIILYFILYGDVVFWGYRHEFLLLLMLAERDWFLFHNLPCRILYAL